MECNALQRIESLGHRIRNRTCPSRRGPRHTGSCLGPSAMWVFVSFVAWSLPSAVAAQSEAEGEPNPPRAAEGETDEWGQIVDGSDSDGDSQSNRDDGNREVERDVPPEAGRGRDGTNSSASRKTDAERAEETYIGGLRRGPSLTLVRVTAGAASSGLSGAVGGTGGLLGGMMAGFAVPRYFIPLSWVGTFGGASAAQTASVYAVGTRLGGAEGLGPALATAGGSVAGLGGLIGIVHYNNSTPVDENIPPAVPALVASAGPVIGFEVANAVLGEPPQSARSPTNVRFRPTGSFAVPGAGGIVGVNVEY